MDIDCFNLDCVLNYRAVRVERIGFRVVGVEKKAKW